MYYIFLIISSILMPIKANTMYFMINYTAKYKII
jgi:hypothetical protein